MWPLNSPHRYKEATQGATKSSSALTAPKSGYTKLTAYATTEAMLCYEPPVYLQPAKTYLISSIVIFISSIHP